MGSVCGKFQVRVWDKNLPMKKGMCREREKNN